MKAIGCTLFLWSWFVLSAVAGDTLIISGVVSDIDGSRVGGILIHISSDELVVDTRTTDDGAYSVEVSETGEAWTVMIDDAELLERGYFCEPGFVVDPDPGIFLIQIPVLVPVPLRPDISFERTSNGVSCVRLSFDWLGGIQPSLLRQYRVERSTDMKAWVEVMTVALACPPIEFFDQTQSDEASCYYRVIPIDPVVIGELLPGDFEFIADPAMGWEGEPLLEFREGDPLPDSPILAPEIFLLPAE